MIDDADKQHALPFVSVILPVYNEERYLESCLSTLKEIDYPRERYEIITVDNGSDDDSLVIAQRYADKSLSLPDKNVGAVRNFGVEHAAGDILVFLDSDCLVRPSWLRQGVELLSGDDKSVFGGNLHLRKDARWIESCWLLDNRKLTQRDLLGSCIFIYRDAFERAGSFDESVSSGEDSALSMKLAGMGYKVKIDHRLGVVHLGNPTTIPEFVKRQVWHAENYVRAFSDSIKDKMFWLVVIYITGWVGIFISITISPWVGYISLLFILLMPAVLSLKRVIRTRYRIKTLSSMVGIYVLDQLYLVGRATGLIRGLVRSIFSIS